MSDTLSLVVLAAGIGSRYGGLKQMDPMGPSGEIILDYSVYDALAAGFGKVVFVISRAIEDAFRDRIGRSIEKRVDTAYAFQRLDALPDGFDVPPGRKKPWGTAHAVLASQPEVDGPFAVINADDFYGRGAYHAAASFLRRPPATDGIPDYCMVGYRLENTLTEHGHVARAVCRIDEDGLLQDARERTRIERQGGVIRFTEEGGEWSELAPGTIVSMNLWGFTPAIFDEINERFPRFLAENRADLSKVEFYIPNLVAALIHDGRARVTVLPTQERWHGVTYGEDKPQVKAALEALVGQGVYPPSLWGGSIR